MIGALEHRLAMAGRRAAMGATGGLLIVVGAAFLVLALWIVLAEAYGAATASLVLGAVLTGAGFIVLGLSRRRRATTAAQARRTDMLTASIEAFFVGLTTAMNMRQRR